LHSLFFYLNNIDNKLTLLYNQNMTVNASANRISSAHLHKFTIAAIAILAIWLIAGTPL